jgi:hypothetical protein
MKGSKEKEHRISNLKNMINNVKDDEENSEFEEELEEDSELIDYLNEDGINYDELEINDDFIYHPDDDHGYDVDLEENPIDEDFIIKTPKTEDIEENDEYDEYGDDFVGEISENFDNVINAKIKGRPILAIVSSILGVIFIGISIFIFESRSDRVIDNVVAGESSFMFVIFIILGVFLLVYGIFKLFNFRNPFEKITRSIDDIENNKKENDDKNNTPKEKPSPKVIPKSNIPLDKESYKIGEFDFDDIKNPTKKSTNSDKNKKSSEENIDDIPPAKEKSNNELSSQENEKKDYEYSELENESIDDIFAEVEDIDDMPIISIDSKEE